MNHAALNSDYISVPLSLIDESDRFRLRQPPYPNLEDLAEKIRTQGQSTALFVRPAGGRFELISGYRRRAALVLVNAATAVVRVCRLDDRAAYELAVSENADRDSITDMERADAALHFQKEGYSLADIARHLGLASERWATSYLQLARESTLPLREALQKKRLSLRAGVEVLAALKAFPASDHQALVQAVVDKNLSGKRLAAFFADERKKREPTPSTPPIAAADQHLRPVRGGYQLASLRIVETAELPPLIATLETALQAARKMRRAQERKAAEAAKAAAMITEAPTEETPIDTEEDHAEDGIDIL